jgi:hypothetical protein
LNGYGTLLHNIFGAPMDLELDRAIVSAMDREPPRYLTGKMA